MTLSLEPASFDALKREWAELAASAPTGSVFTTPTWGGSWWEGQRTNETFAALAFRRNGKLVGLAPFMVCNDAVRLLALSDVCDYHDFLYASGEEGYFFPALLQAIEQQGWKRLELEGLVESSPSIAQITGAAVGRGWTVEQQDDGVSPGLSLPATWDAYIEGLAGSDRHELRRKLRKLTGAGKVESFDAVKRHDLEQVMTTFAGLMRSSREDKAQFLTPEREQFFRTLAHAMKKEGWLRVYNLTLDGQVVAASMLFDYRNGYYLYNSGFDTNYATLSVGLLAKALCLKDAIENGKGVFSFLRGAEPYKYSLGAKDVRLYKLTMQKG